MRRLPVSAAMVAVLLAGQLVAAAPLHAASPYLLPVPAGTTVLVFQGNNSAYDHNAQNGSQYAWDFTVGATQFPVVAARGGTVIGARSDSTNTNCYSIACWTDANYVVIDHGDGTSALYLHLKTGSVTVKAGQPVTQGTLLGNADSTGFSYGTHLHFMVETTPTSRSGSSWWWTQSLTITFADAGLPLVDQSYTSQNVAHATPTPATTVDLASLLPSTIGGVKAKITSASGSAILNGSTFSDAVKALAAKLGVQIDDVQFATASYAPGTHVTAYRFTGAPEAALLAGWLAGPEAQPGVTISKATLGGKSVMKWTASGAGTGYIYAHNDVVFIVGAVSQTDSAEAVSKLP